MYKIDNVSIHGFWGRCSAFCEFRDDVNIIIGKNGAGKTTFMEILHAILVVDADGIMNNEFDFVEIHLSENGKSRTVKARKIYEEGYPFQLIEYQISQKKYRARILSPDDSVRRGSPSFRRHVLDEYAQIRNELNKLVSVSSLSVYRLRNDDEYEVRDRHGSRVLSPVDFRLSEVMKGLTRYQLSLSVQAREISARLQKDVLASILFNEEDARVTDFAVEFDKDTEKTKLISAYTQLSAIDSDVRKKISFHVNSIDQALKDLKGESSQEERSSKSEADYANAFKSLEALRKTKKIISMSLQAEENTKDIFSQIDKFLKILKEFISDKEFIFEKGELVISNRQGRILSEKLSSGEKQLIILLAEALLQDKKSNVFLADEPELSLHIEWQRMVIPAVRELNPNAQVIVATHSPEIAAKYKASIKSMGKIING